MPPNRERTGVRAGIVIALIGVALMIVPSVSGMNMMNGGYALQFIGLFVGLVGLVVFLVYRPRAAAFKRIVAGDGQLAHWTVAPAQVQQEAAAEMAETYAMNRGLFLITTVLIVVIGVPVLVVPMWGDLVRGSDPIAAVVLLCYFSIIPLLGLFAWGMPRLAYRHALQDGAHVYVTGEGVFFHGAFHTWKTPFAKLLAVRYACDRRPHTLEFDIRYLTRLGVIHYETTTVRVPVPPGEERQAEKVLGHFNAPILTDVAA
jgi:hypothetical protein